MASNFRKMLQECAKNTQNEVIHLWTVVRKRNPSRPAENECMQDGLQVDSALKILSMSQNCKKHACHRSLRLGGSRKEGRSGNLKTAGATQFGISGPTLSECYPVSNLEAQHADSDHDCHDYAISTL